MMQRHCFARVPACLAGCAIVLFAGCAKQSATAPAPTPSASASPTPAPGPPQLAFGGRTILPGHRIVAFYGAADTPSMGVLGGAPPLRITPRLLRQAHAYARYGQPIVPAFELIATVAQRDPGAGGKYSAPTDAATIQTYVTAAKRMRGMLILDIQPGRASFLPEVQRYERFLKDPGVSLALDSEWSMGPTEIPAQVIGGTSATAVNAVSDYLARLIAANDLPQKLLIVHQFTPDMISDRAAIVGRPGIAIVFHVDGFGSRAAKLSKYAMLSKNRHGAFMGFKLFYDQDIDMLSPADVMRMRPRPSLVTYQ